MFFKKFFKDIIKILFIFIQFFPGKTGRILRKLVVVSFFKKKGSNVNLEIGVEITGFKNELRALNQKGLRRTHRPESVP